MTPSGTIKLVLPEETFMSIPAQRTLGLVSKIHGVFINRNLVVISGRIGVDK